MFNFFWNKKRKSEEPKREFWPKSIEYSPANRLEEILLSAENGMTNWGFFLEELMRSKIYVLGYTLKDKMVTHMKLIEDKKFVFAYTSEAAYIKASHFHHEFCDKFIEGTAVDFLEHFEKMNSGILFNIGLPFGSVFEPKKVKEVIEAYRSINRN